jgi:hypothetical protein
MIDVEGLRQILERAALVGRDRVAEVGVRSHDDHGQLRSRTADLAHEIEAGLPGHADVGDQHIGCGIAAQRGERGLGALEALGQHAAVLERALQHPADGSIVVDEPDSNGLRIHDG